MNRIYHPFWVIVNKEVSDHMRSWRFIIMIVLIALTCMGSLYTALTNIGDSIKPNDPDNAFLFLKLFTVSDGTLPSFVVFISFLGPLLGIALGFDAINSEQNRGTLSRILSQPIHRDYLINAKFVGALIVIGIMLFSLGFLVMGFGLIAIGIPPTAEEFLRMVFFIIVSIFYVAFWLNLSIFFSIQFRQAATSALACVAIWLFFSVFYNMIINLIGKALSPSGFASDYQIISYQRFMLNLLRFAPVVQRCNDYLADAFCQKSGTVDDGTGAWGYPQSVASGPEPDRCLAAADRVDCSNSCLFCLVLRFFYEKGSSFPLIRLISEKALTCVWDKSLSLIAISLFMQFPV